MWGPRAGARRKQTKRVHTCGYCIRLGDNETTLDTLKAPILYFASKYVDTEASEARLEDPLADDRLALNLCSCFSNGYDALLQSVRVAPIIPRGGAVPSAGGTAGHKSPSELASSRSLPQDTLIWQPHVREVLAQANYPMDDLMTGPSPYGAPMACPSPGASGSRTRPV